MTAANRDPAWGGSGGGGPPVFPPVESLNDLTLAGNLGVKGGRPWFDVKAFGALADGVADDTSAFTAAMTAAVGGGVVYVPPGTYKITSSIQLPVLGLGALSLQGAGAARTQINYSGTGACFLVGDGGATDARWTTIADMRISGTATPTGAIKLNNTRFTRIRDVAIWDFTNAAAVGIDFLGAVANYFCTIEHCQFWGTGSNFPTGIRLLGTGGIGGNSNTIKECYFAGTVTAILVDGVTSNRIRDCEFASAITTGVKIQSTSPGCSDTRIESNNFDTVTTPVDLVAGGAGGKVMLLLNGGGSWTGPNNYYSSTVRIDSGYGPRALVYKAALQTITSSVETAITCDSERYDTEALHDTVTNNSRVTIKHGGEYQLAANVVWGSSAAGQRQAIIKLNGVTDIVKDIKPTTAAGNPAHVLSGSYHMNAGDYVELRVFQDSGGNLDVLGNTYSPTLSVSRLG